MAKMRKACREMWQVVPCTSKRTLRTESQKDIKDILQGKLATIVEEPEISEEYGGLTPQPRHVLAIKKGRKLRPKMNKMGQVLLPHFSLRDYYAVFITGFASKGSFGGLLQY